MAIQSSPSYKNPFVKEYAFGVTILKLVEVDN